MHSALFYQVQQNVLAQQFRAAMGATYAQHAHETDGVILSDTKVGIGGQVFPLDSPGLAPGTPVRVQNVGRPAAATYAVVGGQSFSGGGGFSAGSGSGSGTEPLPQALGTQAGPTFDHIHITNAANIGGAMAVGGNLTAANAYIATRVGIGTTSPLALLDVFRTLNPEMQLTWADPTTLGWLFYVQYGAGSQTIVGNLCGIGTSYAGTEWGSPRASNMELWANQPSGNIILGTNYGGTAWPRLTIANNGNVTAYGTIGVERAGTVYPGSIRVPLVDRHVLINNITQTGGTTVAYPMPGTAVPAAATAVDVILMVRTNSASASSGFYVGKGTGANDSDLVMAFCPATANYWGSGGGVANVTTVAGTATLFARWSVGAGTVTGWAALTGYYL